MTPDQTQKLKELSQNPNWQTYLDVAEEIIQEEDRLSTLPKFKTATALKSYVDTKKRAFEMFKKLVELVDYTPDIDLYDNEHKSFYKTIDEKSR